MDAFDGPGNGAGSHFPISLSPGKGETWKRGQPRMALH